MYIFENTEQNNAKANDYETKALLYLLSYRKDSDQIETFAIDCFNDVTGCNEKYTRLWDIQSKNVKSLNPKTIGKSLITLYFNFEHSFPFKYFILFIPKLKIGYLENENAKTFNFGNFQKSYKSKIIVGLSEEYKRRKNKEINDKFLSRFLSKIIFVIGDETKVNYIKNITNFTSNIIQDKFFEEIFDEIRNKQTTIKNISIHNKSINKPNDVEIYKKIFKRTDFDTLIINRFIGYDLFKDLNTIPNSFVDSIKNYNVEERKDILQNSNAEIARCLFDKNNKKQFWLFFEKLIVIIKSNLNLSTEDIYVLLNGFIERPYDLSVTTVKYLISLIKDGWKEEE